MFFDSWGGLARVVIVGSLAYVALIVVLRIGGKRTLAKLNAFDLVVTVALGSTLATILLTKDVSLFEGVVAFFLLAALQFVIAWSAQRSALVMRIVSATPRILLRDGEPDLAALRSERMSLEDVDAAIRSAGYGDRTLIAAVVLETDGSLSVISKGNVGSLSALPDR